MTSGTGSNLPGSWGFSAGLESLWSPTHPSLSPCFQCSALPSPCCCAVLYGHILPVANPGCPQVCPEKLRITLLRKHLPVPPGPGASWAAGLGGEQGGESVV